MRNKPYIGSKVWQATTVAKTEHTPKKIVACLRLGVPSCGWEPNNP